MGKLLIKDKAVAVPGEEIAEGLDYVSGSGARRENNKIIASMLGLVSISGRTIKLIPLAGKYLPKKEDIIIGKVIDVTINGWRIDLNSAYSAMLSMRDATSEFIARGADLTKYYTFGDYVMVKITNVTSQNLVDVTMRGPGLRKLIGGRIIMVNPHKIPRIIGKGGSMVNMIKEATGCKILVGQNGLVWVDGEPENELTAIKSIKKIEKEAHLSGLTERIQNFLKGKNKR